MLDLVRNGDIHFIINTPSGKIPREDEVRIRNASLARKIPIMTTIRAAQASAQWDSFAAEKQPAGETRSRNITPVLEYPEPARIFVTLNVRDG